MNSLDARTKRDESRSRFRQTLAETKSRLAPLSLARDGAEAVKRTVKTRPVATAGAVVAAALFALRKPVFSALLRLTKEKRHD